MWSCSALLDLALRPQIPRSFGRSVHLLRWRRCGESFANHLARCWWLCVLAQIDAFGDGVVVPLQPVAVLTRIIVAAVQHRVSLVENLPLPRVHHVTSSRPSEIAHVRLLASPTEQRMIIFVATRSV